MISELLALGSASTNGHARSVTEGHKHPERSGWELLAWAILEQAVDDLVIFCRFGIVTPAGKCLPWPWEQKRRFKLTRKGPQFFWHRVPRAIAGCKGPNDHRQLRAWFLSEEAQTFCDLIGCKLPPREIYWAVIKNHGGLK
jgi:hypothetical protein